MLYLPVFLSSATHVARICFHGLSYSEVVVESPEQIGVVIACSNRHDMSSCCECIDHWFNRDIFWLRSLVISGNRVSFKLLSLEITGKYLAEVRILR